MDETGIRILAGQGALSSQLQKRAALVKYLLYQVWGSRKAYFPDGHGGPVGEAQTDNINQSAAAIAAAGAEGLADSLSPSVKVADMLDSLVSSKAEKLDKPSVIADAPTWRSFLKLVPKEELKRLEGLELYLCERLLPLVHSGIAALCEFVEILQADKHQFQLQQQSGQQDESQRTASEEDLSAHGRSTGPGLLLGQGVHRRFDPLVWLGQYLIRTHKAAEAYNKASCLAAQGGSGLRAADHPKVRGEHIRVSELPLYEFIAAEVTEERSWRALEALRPQVELIYQQIKHKFTHLMQKRMLPERQVEQEAETHSRNPARFPAGNLALLLHAVDTAWGLADGQGFLAAVVGPEAEVEEQDHQMSFFSSKSSEMDLVLPMSLESFCGSQNSRIMGACTSVPLEVANGEDITSAECLDAGGPLEDKGQRGSH
ncbi:hypothetical protein Efla_003199 [Eimeria flavescens]